MQLVPGQNASLDGTVWDFSVRTPPYIALLVLFLDEHHGATIFANRDSTSDPDTPHEGIRIDLTSVPADVTRIVCTADTGPGLDNAPPPAHLVANLSCPTESTFEITVPQQSLHPAMICLELYRRNARWKIRAIGQGYAAGRAELLSSHGLTSRHAPTSPSHRSTTPAFPAVLPGDPNTLERLRMIFEDVARTTAGFTAARDYAAIRLDEEMSTAVADPTTRHSQAAERALGHAQTRHDELLAQARAAFENDINYLQTELAQVDHTLPPSAAPWSSPAWHTATRPCYYDEAIRIGALSADDLDPLSIPYCVKAPLHQPIWITPSASDTALPETAAIVLRLLATNSSVSPSLDVIDPTGRLRTLTTKLGEIAPRAVAAHHNTALGHITDIARALEVRTLTAQADGRLAPPAIVVLSDFDFSLDYATPLATLLSLVNNGALSLIIVGNAVTDDSPADPLTNELQSLCQIIPLNGTGVVIDQWTQQHWRFHCDTLPESSWTPALLKLQSLFGTSARG